MRVVSIILSSWAVLYWPGLLIIASADYFAPSALPLFTLFGLGLSAVAYVIHKRVEG